MGSPKTDLLLLNGVGAIVKDLAEFQPIRTLFRTQIARWRKKHALIVGNLVKAEAQLRAFALREPRNQESPKETWPLRRIRSGPGMEYSELVPIRPDLYRKVEKREDRQRNHLLNDLEHKRDWTPSECFTMLAEIHDAAHPRFPIGPMTWRGVKEDGHADYVLDVDRATERLTKGLSLVEAESLANVVERVLDRIAARADSKTKNESGKTLKQIVERSRQRLNELVAHARQHFVSQADQDSVRHEVSKLRNDVVAMNETQRRRLAEQTQASHRRHQQQQTEAGGPATGDQSKAVPTSGSRALDTRKPVRRMNVQKVEGTERSFKIDRKPVRLSPACANLLSGFIALIESREPATPANLMTKLTPKYDKARKRFENDKGRFNDALKAAGIAKGLYVVGDVLQLCKPPKDVAVNVVPKKGMKKVRRG